jgi:hypothetical protein
LAAGGLRRGRKNNFLPISLAFPTILPVEKISRKNSGEGLPTGFDKPASSVKILLFACEERMEQPRVFRRGRRAIISENHP